jgi:hypothetical protein
VNDAELVLEMSKAIRKDPQRPSLNQRFNPTDPVAIEIVLHETDYSVESYMEKWKAEYRDRFEDPTVYDNFVLEWQMRARKEVKALIAAAQEYIAEEIELQQEIEDEGEEGDAV